MWRRVKRSIYVWRRRKDEKEKKKREKRVWMKLNKEINGK